MAERKQMPVWAYPRGGDYPEYEAALHRIEKHSHLWILAWLAKGRDERHVLEVTPRGVTAAGPEGCTEYFRCGRRRGRTRSD